MDYIKGVLRGAHLLAHTWASRPIAHGVCFGCSGKRIPPPMDHYGYYTMEGGRKSIENMTFCAYRFYSALDFGVLERERPASPV